MRQRCRWRRHEHHGLALLAHVIRWRAAGYSIDASEAMEQVVLMLALANAVLDPVELLRTTPIVGLVSLGIVGFEIAALPPGQPASILRNV